MSEDTLKAFRDLVGTDPDAAPVFRLKSDPKGRLWSLLDSYCVNPECDGEETWIQLVSAGEPSGSLGFWLNYGEGNISWDEKPTEEAKAMALEFANDHVVARLIVRRRQLARGHGLKESGLEEPYESGQTYTLGEFSPRGEVFAIPFEAEGHEWAVVDQYCVNPGCGCREAILGFYRYQEGREIQQQEFAVRLDFETGNPRNMEEGPLDAGREGVVRCFLAELGDWRLELGRRRDLVRLLAKGHLMFEVAEEGGIGPNRLDSGPRVGRNAPCPCGSGKKFKRCCGR